MATIARDPASVFCAAIFEAILLSLDTTHPSESTPWQQGEFHRSIAPLCRVSKTWCTAATRIVWRTCLSDSLLRFEPGPRRQQRANTIRILWVRPDHDLTDLRFPLLNALSIYGPHCSDYTPAFRLLQNIGPSLRYLSIKVALDRYISFDDFFSTVQACSLLTEVRLNPCHIKFGYSGHYKNLNLLEHIMTREKLMSLSIYLPEEQAIRLLRTDKPLLPAITDLYLDIEGPRAIDCIHGAEGLKCLTIDHDEEFYDYDTASSIFLELTKLVSVTRALEKLVVRHCKGSIAEGFFMALGSLPQLRSISLRGHPCDLPPMGESRLYQLFARAPRFESLSLVFVRNERGQLPQFDSEADNLLQDVADFATNRSDPKAVVWMRSGSGTWIRNLDSDYGSVYWAF